MADRGNLQPVISDGYREMQQSLHKDANYGVASQAFAPLVAAVLNECGAAKLLDYGSGKGRLREALAEHISQPVDVQEYDPAIPGKDEKPEPCEFVACLDVLEHIEPELLNNVLDDLKRVTERFGLFTISTVAAAKALPDGRNAHLIQEEMEWWMPKLMERFRIYSFARVQGGFWVVVTRKD